MSTPLRRAARAAYTRPDTSVPFERRPLARQTYWTQAALRALNAALDPDELAEVITAHNQYDYDTETGLYRCTCGGYLTTGWPNHIAAALRAHALGHDQQITTPHVGDQHPSQPSRPGTHDDGFDGRGRAPHLGGQ